ncbi:rhomboid family intramembrane serine protease [Oceanirhabdus sp. W0125-5]|uniref:rhomboid family intramembrane serine protease n=1 Tax=Oceanirhabdus sp. W0125-5 TaxID=2999116 RepID=UPI0022F345E6|nr:rhomboid family intramembrane serine protease [Oceanirhabdus sp. W0125-5]WBW95162.1 rhomboid family intramembrane serine protease [Oceanirhabdus sp. W0125-5]
MKKLINKITYNSPVILSFTFLSFIVLLLGVITKGYSTRLFSNYSSSLLNPLTYIRLFSHVLGHGNFEHFFGNFMIILIVGPIIEEKYGSKKLLIMILITAFVTGVINSLFFNTILLGASGIAFMLILLSSVVNTRAGEIPLTLIIVFLVFVGKELYVGITQYDNISQLTHVIGGLCGSGFGYYLLKE